MSYPVLNVREYEGVIAITLDGEAIIRGKRPCLRFAKRLRDVAQQAGAASVQSRWAGIVEQLEAA